MIYYSVDNTLGGVGVLLKDTSTGQIPAEMQVQGEVTLQPNCKSWSLSSPWSRGTSGNSKWAHTLLHFIQNLQDLKMSAYINIFYFNDM